MYRDRSRRRGPFSSIVLRLRSIDGKFPSQSRACRGDLGSKDAISTPATVGIFVLLTSALHGDAFADVVSELIGRSDHDRTVIRDHRVGFNMPKSCVNSSVEQ